MILKHFIKMTAAALALAAVGFAASCSDDNPDTPPAQENVLKNAKGVYTYSGDVQDNGKGAYTLCFTTAKVQDNKVTGPGDVYYFELYSSLSTLATPLPEEGTYTFDAQNTFAVNTIAAKGSYMGTLKSGTSELTDGSKVEYTDATLTLTVSGSRFYAEGTVTLKTGKTITINRTSFTYIVAEPEPQDLKRDVDLDFVRSAYGTGGDRYQNNTTYNAVFLYIPTTGEKLRLDLTGPATPEKTAPILEGTYTISTSTEEMNCMVGSLSSQEEYVGSHYVNEKTGEVGFLKSGTIKITAAEGNVYTVEVDAMTDLGYKVKGEYLGGIVFNGGEEAPTTLLTTDHVIDFSNVTKGTLMFFGDFYKNGTQLIVVDLNPEKGKAEGLAMYLLQADQSENLEEHTYEASYNNTVYTFIPGYADALEFEPTTFYIYDEQAKGTDVQAPIHAGTIKITQEGANWNFEIDVYDDANNHITGSWTGPLEVKKS